MQKRLIALDKLNQQPKNSVLWDTSRWMICVETFPVKLIWAMSFNQWYNEDIIQCTSAYSTSLVRCTARVLFSHPYVRTPSRVCCQKARLQFLCLWITGFVLQTFPLTGSNEQVWTVCTNQTLRKIMSQLMPVLPLLLLTRYCLWTVSWLASAWYIL